MRLSCELEITYSLAVSSGSVPSRSSRSRAVITAGKKPGPTPARGTSGHREELYIIVSTVKNVAGSKYKVERERERQRERMCAPVVSPSSRCICLPPTAGEGKCGQGFLQVCRGRQGHYQIQRTCTSTSHLESELPYHYTT